MFKWLFAFFEKKPEEEKECPHDSVGPNARKAGESDSLHGAAGDRLCTAYRGPGGSTITD